MGSHRKSIFDTIVFRLTFFCIVEISFINASDPLKLKSELEKAITPKPQVLYAAALVTGETKTEVQISGPGSTSDEILVNNQDQKDKREIEMNKKKEDFTTFASFLVEIIVFFVFLAVLLSFITLCARKCGGNPSNNGRIYGPGPIMGGLIADPEVNEYEPSSGLIHNFRGPRDYPIQATMGDHFVQNDGRHYSTPASDYSDYQSQADAHTNSRAKKPKKKKIPGPTF